MGHLDDVKETYWQHFKFAMRLSFLACSAFGAFFIHALFPFALKTTGSDRIQEIHDIIKERNAEPEPLDEDRELFI